MSKMPWEMSAEEIKEAIGERLPALDEKPVDARKMPWEMAYEEIRSFFKPKEIKIQPDKVEPKRPKGFDLETYMKTTAAVESGNNPTAKAKTSTATGLYQFTAQTWDDMVNKLGLNYTREDRKDVVKAETVMKEFTSRNVERAKADLGREPTHTDVYMYHFLGRSAPKLLQADENTPAVNHVTKAQARANSSVFYRKDGSTRTVKEVLEKYRGRYQE